MKILKSISIIFQVSLAIFLLASCKTSVNFTDIDDLSTIDVFEHLDDNLNLGKDIICINWNAILKEKYSDFDTTSTQELKLFINPIPEENIVKVQIHYPKFDQPSNYDQIRDVMVKHIEEMKNFQKENEEFILKSKAKLDEVISYLDNENYQTFYNHLDTMMSNKFSYFQFMEFINQMKTLGYKKELREYKCKNFVRVKDASGMTNDIIEYYLSQKNNEAKLELFAFKNVNGKIAVVGYRANQ